MESDKVIEFDKVLEIEKPPAGPPVPAEDTKEYGGIGRIVYWLGMFGVNVLIIVLIVIFIATGERGLLLLAALIVIPLTFFLIVTRLHNIGMSGSWSLLMLVPIAGLFVHFRCLVYPEGYQDTKKLDTAGKVLAAIVIASLVFVVIAGIVPVSPSSPSDYSTQAIKDYFFPPKDVAAIEKQGDASYEAGEYQEALRQYRDAADWYERLDKLDSRDRAEFKQARAQLYVALKDPDVTDTERTEHYTSAIARLGKLSRHSPKYADPQRLLCDIAWGEAVHGRQPGSAPWMKLVQQCTKLLDIDPNDHQGHFRRGYANARLAGLMKGKYFAEAEADLRKAIELKSDIPDYWMELARFLQSRQRTDDAHKIFRDAMAANPDSAELKLMYSDFLRREGRSDDGLQKATQPASTTKPVTQPAPTTKPVTQPAPTTKPVTQPAPATKAAKTQDKTA